MRPRPMLSPGDRRGPATEKMHTRGEANHRDLLVALDQMTIDERVRAAEAQIGAPVHGDVAEERDRHVAPLELGDHPTLAVLGLGIDEVRLPERRFPAEDYIERR